MFLLDTNVISELRKARAGRADPNVLAWFNECDANTCYLSVISVLELELGILQVERRDERQGSALRNWLENQVLPEFESRLLPIDQRVAKVCAGLHVPDPRSERNAFIAASALVNGMAVVSRNVGDFDGSGVKLINPWEGAL